MATLGHFLTLNHPFVDGNKRTAWEAMRIFTKKNGRLLRAKPKEIVELMLRIEDKSFGVNQIAEWLKEHSLKWSPNYERKSQKGPQKNGSLIEP